MIQISVVNTYESPDGETIKLPEVWGAYPEAGLNNVVLLHSKQEVMGRRAPTGYVWVRAYAMNPPDHTWKLTGTNHG